ncbi:hypothetical protein M7794_13510 [Enterobacter chuandaensis]|uniref:hypothetical protein n=1 Tax=Enterobacter chuandaensis TaxID=2497875 RepID=UPI00223735D6|nr:hypothetical protein [Enterobacter chuandaensis]MCW4783049.1 hypothetical protein [Enterobacter chuandaensis]
MNINLILKFMVLAFLSIQYQNVFAKQTGASLEISFTGHLMGRRSCMVNENKIIYIDFGSVGLKKYLQKKQLNPLTTSLTVVVLMKLTV